VADALFHLGIDCAVVCVHVDLQVNRRFPASCSPTESPFSSYFWSFFNFGAVFAGMATMIYTSPVFWLGLLLTPVAALLLDVVIKV
jgi:hypothetical protein